MGKMDYEWEAIHSSKEWGAYPSEPVIRFVARNFYNVPVRKDVKILDFGCGQGANTWYIAREGFDAYAFDGSKSAIKKAEQRLKKDGLDATFSVYEGIDIKYKKMMFSAVIDNFCIYANRIADIKTMYKSIYGVLQPGGKIFTACFGEKCSGYQTGDEIEPNTYKNIRTGNLKHEGVQHIFSEKEIVELLKEVGFINVTCDMLMYTDRGAVNHQYICVADKSERT